MQTARAVAAILVSFDFQAIPRAPVNSYASSVAYVSISSGSQVWVSSVAMDPKSTDDNAKVAAALAGASSFKIDYDLAG